MNERPRISVIIPVYNGAKFLARAVDSVLKQTYPAHEIIVVDDGSTDDTPRVMAELGQKIRPFRIPNAGPAGARNEGMKRVTGDTIAFLDCDDIWFRNKLERQADALTRFPEAGFVCCDFAVRYPRQNFRMIKHFSILRHRALMNFDAPLKENPFKLLIIEHFVGTTSAVVIRKAVTDQVGPFNPEYRSSQDYDYWLRAALVTNVVVLSDVLFYKVNHPQNISANPQRTHAYRRKILENIIASRADDIRRLHLEHTCRMSLVDCDLFRGNIEYDAGRKGEAFRLYWQAFTEYSCPSSFIRFVWTAGKKVVRLLSFGLLSRQTLRRHAH